MHLSVPFSRCCVHGRVSGSVVWLCTPVAGVGEISPELSVPVRPLLKPSLVAHSRIPVTLQVQQAFQDQLHGLPLPIPPNSLTLISWELLSSAHWLVPPTACSTFPSSPLYSGHS